MTRLEFIWTGHNYNLCNGYKYPMYSETLCISKVTLDQTVQDIKCANTTQLSFQIYGQDFISYS